MTSNHEQPSKQNMSGVTEFSKYNLYIEFKESFKTRDSDYYNKAAQAEETPLETNINKDSRDELITVDVPEAEAVTHSTSNKNEDP
ncbi:10392_t:CDS:2 [Ambispora leptoticha]|uniref:10392_t:CDS:1 n=1 Tax=Ambispora leptoticha TaxID=144679 RepID=A0A9N9G7I9_9GLOM|nr:10392_t:CDS:2 [Ambispora leptoticha]